MAKKTNRRRFCFVFLLIKDIAEIPDNIRHCRALQKLDCSGNPLANK